MKKHFGFAALVAANLTAYAQVSDLSQGFQHPPQSSKPRVWWHWMNGNISKEGIKKDFDWMSKTGIGGFQNFDASLMTPVVVPEKLVYMTPAWKDAFRFATDYAKEKNLEMAIAGSPGWSVTGGPWVAPADAMKNMFGQSNALPVASVFRSNLRVPRISRGPCKMCLLNPVD